MTRGEIVRRVNKVILEEFDVAEADLKPGARLGEDLGLDSLDGIDLVVAIEREFRDVRVKVREAEARRLTTLDAIYDHVASLANAAG